MMFEFDGFIPFEMKHLEEMDLNEFSNTSEFMHVLTGDSYHKFTLYDGSPKLVFAFREYHKDNYDAFILADKSMKLKHGLVFRKMIEEAAKRYGAKRIHTLSVDCDKLNKWHEYLGFTCEGVHKKIMNNKDYRMWAKLWE